MRFDEGCRQSRRRMKVALSGWGGEEKTKDSRKNSRDGNRDPATLRAAASPLPWARRLLFAQVEFCFTHPCIGLWKIFLNPENSSVHHPCSHSVPRPSLRRGGDECGRLEVRTFHHIVTLSVNIIGSPSFSTLSVPPSFSRASRWYRSPRMTLIAPSTSPKHTHSPYLGIAHAVCIALTARPPRRPPLLQDHRGMFLRRCRVNDGFGVGVL